VLPPLEAKKAFDQDVACHLYESAEGYDPYEDLQGSSAATDAGDGPESTPADD
jgi:peptide/nickel transport system ATP-binding protein